MSSNDQSFLNKSSEKTMSGLVEAPSKKTMVAWSCHRNNSLIKLKRSVKKAEIGKKIIFVTNSRFGGIM